MDEAKVLTDTPQPEVQVFAHVNLPIGTKTTFSRQEIIAAVQGENYPVTDRNVDVQIAGLRKKLGPHGARIETVRGKGYRFVAAPTA